MGDLAGILRDFFRTHKIKVQTFQGKLQTFVREKIRASKKLFSANFVLQTCHSKDLLY